MRNGPEEKNGNVENKSNICSLTGNSTAQQKMAPATHSLRHRRAIVCTL